MESGIAQVAGFPPTVQNYELVVEAARHYQPSSRLVLLEGMQYKIRLPPMPPFSLLFQLCIRFQEYVREECATGRDLWKEYLHGEDEFLVKGYETGKEKVLFPF